MKILELRFKNLNSLYGEWQIDFTDPEYVSSGIFALTGPTGAGKSTILDAICLALYGATPRLGRITKSGNEIMSRRTGECYAEVVFESQAGRFRCQWQQHRSRKKADGALQDQHHQISEAGSGKLIENKKSKVIGIIEEKTGMDFDRFTRSVLLAQGGFDTFLKADVEQKSKILEQITGTGIYSEISKKVHERKREEDNRLALLQRETKGIDILDPDQEAEILKELEAKKKEETALTGRHGETGKAITWLTTIDNLKKEIDSLTDEREKLQAGTEAFKPDRDRLEKEIRASALDSIYATLTTLKKQQADDLAALKAEEAALPALETSAKKHVESLKKAELLTLKTKEDLKTAAPLIRKIRLLDQKNTEQAKAVAEMSQSCSREAAAVEKEKSARFREASMRPEAEKALEAVEKYINEHQQDEWLVSGLAGIEEQFGSLLAKHNEMSQKETDLKNAEKSIFTATKRSGEASMACNARREELETASKNIRQAKEVLRDLLGDKLLREYRFKKESLQKEKEYLSIIASLEDHRAKLEDGKSCPLCGSTDHPFAEGNVPEPDEIEKQIESLGNLILRAEDQEAVIKKYENAEAAARKDLNESEKLEVEAINDKKAIEKAASDLKTDYTKLQGVFEEQKNAVLQKLKPLGITEISETQISPLLETLRLRQKRWEEQVKGKAELEKQILAIGSELKRLDAVIETQTRALAEKQVALEKLKKEHAAGLVERTELFGDKRTDEEENRLNKVISNAEEAEKKAGSLNSSEQAKLTAAKTAVKSLKERIIRRGPDLEKAETDFSSELEPAGFSDEKHFMSVRLTKEERESLTARAMELDKAQTELTARQKDRDARLKSESAKKVTEKTLQELEPEFKLLEDSLKELREISGGLRHKLSENKAAKERLKDKQQAIDAQKAERLRWEKLHRLIGSENGKRYRNFAQGLTFELMVSHANRQLAKMTDRYLLTRDETEPLELNVVDTWQADEIRSTRNLSGGESFIVSLTLALGLSKMASQKVRVDSLFLDEGFGTLDEAALETALETLAGLHQDGKLIGVISHVPALKERISSQITITPVTGGKSRLTGPGVQATL